jgi:hypothetical protein
MNKLALQFQILVVMLALCAVSAFAQNGRIQIDHLDRLFPKAVETIDVSVDSNLLQLASKFLKPDRAEEAAAREVIAMIKGVYVKGVEFDKDGEYSDQDIETVRRQLAVPGWDRIVGVRSKRSGDNVEVYLMINNGLIDGVSVLLHQPKQLMVVNVIGQIDPEKITQLRGQFGIPKDFDLDFSGVRRTRRNDQKNDN